LSNRQRVGAPDTEAGEKEVDPASQKQPDSSHLIIIINIKLPPAHQLYDYNTSQMSML